MSLRIVIIYFASLVVGLSTSLTKHCDYFQKLDPNVTYQLHSPKNSKLNSKCRWAAEAPEGQNVLIDCKEIKIPFSTFCANDALLISTNGRVDLRDASRHCGTSSFSTKSVSTRMTIGFRASRFFEGGGGRFKCLLRSIDDNSCKCGQMNRAKIVGGSETKINEYPSMAGVVDASERRIYCGATIISKSYALSAAHCAIGRKLSSLALLVGEHDTNKGSESPYTQLLRIASFKIHENFDENDNFNDIGIIRTREFIAFSRGIQPACLPFKFRDEKFIGKSVKAVGWGATEFSGPQSNTLRHVTLSIVEKGNCTQTQICSYAANRDTCQADSGGPIFYIDNNNLYLVGIVSFGFACASNKPSINTRVTAYLDWIQHQTGSANNCVR